MSTPTDQTAPHDLPSTECPPTPAGTSPESPGRSIPELLDALQIRPQEQEQYLAEVTGLIQSVFDRYFAALYEDHATPGNPAGKNHSASNIHPVRRQQQHL